jgi:hypothetical protein
VNFIAFQREHAQVSSMADGSAQNGDLMVPGRIATRSFQGLVDEYAIDLAEGVSIRVLDGQGQFSPGDQVHVRIKAGNLFRLND